MYGKMIKDLIKREGGYIDNPLDIGGPTKYGITQQTLTNYLGRHATAIDVKNLSKKTAAEIYEIYYYRKPNIDELPESLQPVMLDMAANHGPRTAVKILQKLLIDMDQDIRPDGLIGPHTLKSVDYIIYKRGIKYLCEMLIKSRIAFYERIVKNDDTQRKFLPGWIRRAESFLETA